MRRYVPPLAVSGIRSNQSKLILGLTVVMMLLVVCTVLLNLAIGPFVAANPPTLARRGPIPKPPSTVPKLPKFTRGMSKVIREILVVSYIYSKKMKIHVENRTEAETSPTTLIHFIHSASLTIPIDSKNPFVNFNKLARKSGDEVSIVRMGIQ